jgi:hypothetical protein
MLDIIPKLEFVYNKRTGQLINCMEIFVQGKKYLLSLECGKRM